MPDTEKNIPVFYARYEPYEHFPDILETLGCISESELEHIMSAFNTKEYSPDACIRSLSLEYSDHTNFGRTMGAPNRHRSLELSGMFYFDQATKCGKCSSRTSETTKIKRCARNLKNGKCQDEFIRNTLGAILYPQHYATDKQK